MATHTIVKAAADDADSCVAAILLAFSTDPLFRWMFPDPQRYLTHFGALTGVMARASVGCNEAYRSADSVAAGIAMPPGIGADREEVNAILRSGIPEHRRDEVMAALQPIRQSHPEVEHWYIQLIGVDPLRQGEG